MGMKYINLTQGYKTIVDDEDYEWLSKYKWYARKIHTMNSFTAVRNKTVEGKQTNVVMYREIMNAPSGTIVDHINHDTLDNRRSNLRVCDMYQSSRNRRVAANNSTGYKGVGYHKATKKYRARIQAGGKKIDIGYYKDPKDAARAYNERAKVLHGEYAYLNKI